MKKEKMYAIIIVFIALLITVVMIRLGKKKPKSKPLIKAPAVRVGEISPGNIQAEIISTAQIEANQTLNLTPEINGRVVWVSPKFKDGGVVKKGELLLTLDDRDATLAVKQFKVNVENAKLNLEQEKARGEIARNEWESLGEGGEASEMTLRAPQLRIAQLNLLSAESSLEKAKLTLSRTKVRAPFNATIANKRVSLGQVISPQSSVAKLLELGKMRAEVTVPVDQIKWIDIPGIAGVQKGSEVLLFQNIGKGNQLKRTAFVSALIGEIDPQTRRARLNISIPFEKDSELPLLPGAFVEAHIKGKFVENAISIPREGVTAGVNAWIVKADSTLVKIDFQRLWGTNDYVIVKTQKEGTLKLALDLPQVPVNGMKITPISQVGEGGADE